MRRTRWSENVSYYKRLFFSEAVAWTSQIQVSHLGSTPCLAALADTLKLTMDIHRLRIVNYPASPINALAFSHQPNPAHRAPGTLRLAIGRANGDIELWNPSEGYWVQERILHGSEDRSIEGLAWTQDPTYENEDGQIMGGQLRLFSIGYSNTVTEWDIYRGKPERLTDGGGSEIWCFAAQPRSTPSKSLDAASVEGGRHHQKLIAGCADGTLSLLSTVGELRYNSKLPPPHSRKAKVLSVTWQTSDRVVAGYSDNAIRVYDIRGRGRNMQTMSLAPDGKRPDTDVLVWAVRCLPDGTIISGDSSGEVKVWDAATLSLVQQLKSHNADVLTLSPSFDGSAMLSGGIDRRTVTYQRIASGKNKGRWAVASYRRLHASDVKSMASYEAKDLNVVVSGGKTESNDTYQG
jgi:U3 small nucleolar RNA-associated protein 4